MTRPLDETGTDGPAVGGALMTLPQLLLIPGLLNDAGLWCDQMAGLADIARPVVADITRGASLPALARDVLDMAEDRFALCGFSLGGIVALEIMRIAPERISHLALLDTTMLPDAPERRADRERLIRTASQPGRFIGLGEGMLKAYLADGNLGNAGMVRRVREMTARLGAEVFIRQSGIARPDSRPTLGAITCPTLVLCGAEDRLTPPAIHCEMADAIAGAQLVIIPQAGHMTPIEQPDAVNAALRRLIATPA